MVASFESLHRRIYDVHRFGDDGPALHDWLAGSLTGDALTDQYVSSFVTARALQAQDASVEVRRVEYGAITPLPGPPDRVRLDVRWSVGGVLRHAAHRHARVNQYRAVFEIGSTLQGPRILGAAMRDSHRLRHPVLEGGAFDLFAPEPEGPAAWLDPADLLDSIDLDPEAR